jgi:hypothetical protein
MAAVQVDVGTHGHRWAGGGGGGRSWTTWDSGYGRGVCGLGVRAGVRAGVAVRRVGMRRVSVCRLSVVS